jgi:REP element-mobilizing transposase RayT
MCGAEGMVRAIRPAYKSPDRVPTTKWIEHPSRRGCYLPVHNRKLRLPDVDYAAASLVCFVTYNLAESESLLTGAVGDAAWMALLEARDFLHIKLYAACMMPDHVHLLLSPHGDGKTVGQIVKSIKTRQQRLTKQATGHWLNWQADFFDHALGRDNRAADEFDAIVAYIHQNPVAAGLVTHSSDYPYLL